MQNIFSFMLSSYLVLIPALLVWLGGLVIAIARWGKHPRVSALTTLGLLLLAVRALASPWIRFWIQHSDISMAQIGMRFSIFNILSALVSAVAWILILLALFGWREANDGPGAAS